MLADWSIRAPREAPGSPLNFGLPKIFDPWAQFGLGLTENISHHRLSGPKRSRTTFDHQGKIRWDDDIRHREIVTPMPSRSFARAWISQNLSGRCQLSGRIAPGPIPALLTRISIRPNRARVARVISSAAVSDVRSVWMVSSSPALPCSRAATASASNGSRSRSMPATRISAASKPRTIALPMPPAAPVTIATLWISLINAYSSLKARILFLASGGGKAVDEFRFQHRCALVHRAERPGFSTEVESHL